MKQSTGINSAPARAAHAPDSVDDASRLSGAAAALARGEINNHILRRRIHAASKSTGFFTLGIAVVVLAVSSLAAGAAGKRDASESASAPARTEVAGERRQPTDNVTTKSGGSVVISEAASGSPDRAPGDATSAN